MKKLLKILAILLLIVVVTAIAVPFLFEDRLVQIVKDNVNASLEAEVDFGDIDLNLWSDFPDFTFRIEEITVDGIDRFDSLRLASIGEASFTLDVMSVIRGDKLRIEGIHVDQAYLNAVVMEDGTANYDIIKESETEAGDTVDVRDEYVILLEEYDITNSEIIYDNRSLGAFIHLQGLDHFGDGSLTDQRYDLNTLTTAKTVDVRYDDIHYLKKADAEIKAVFDIQDDFREINFKENEIRVNALLLTADGKVLLPEDGVDMDIRYHSTANDLKTLLSLVPSEYMPDLEGLETQGTIDIQGDVIGHYDDFSFPGFSLAAQVKDGRIQYPDLPEDIDEIVLAMELDFPGGGTNFNTTTLDLSSVHMNIAESPITGSLFLKDMVTDPFIRTDVKAQLDLGRVKEAVTMDGVQELKGVITADLDLEGAMSAIEAQRYADFKAAGQLIVQDLRIAGDSIPVPVSISTAHLNFTPAYLEMPNLMATLGESDIKANGRISNYLGYALQNEELKGNIQVESRLLDLNEFLVETVAPVQEDSAASNDSGQELSEGSEEEGIIPVPAGVDLTLDARLDEVRYENLTLNDIRGRIQVKDEVARMENVSMKTLGGMATMDGTYNTQSLEAPAFDLVFKLNGLNISNTASAFNTVKTLAPIAEKTEGSFTSEFRMSTLLDGGMNPIFSSLSGGGDLSTDEVIVENFKALMKIADALQLDNWKSQRVKNIDLDFQFVDGKVVVEPFQVKLDGIESTIGGAMGFDQQLDYDVTMKIPVEKLGGSVDQLLNGLVGQANALGLDFSVGQYLDMAFDVTGPMTDPKISPRILG
ncbi:MAG: AsmA family protein, partial [Flavobacteriales bacterium]|nr:AsmA family protein [Flavobacteriales bacterium]